MVLNKNNQNLESTLLALRQHRTELPLGNSLMREYDRLQNMTGYRDSSAIPRLYESSDTHYSTIEHASGNIIGYTVLFEPNESAVNHEGWSRVDHSKLQSPEQAIDYLRTCSLKPVAVEQHIVSVHSKNNHDESLDWCFDRASPFILEHQKTAYFRNGRKDTHKKYHASAEIYSQLNSVSQSHDVVPLPKKNKQVRLWVVDDKDYVVPYREDLNTIADFLGYCQMAPIPTADAMALEHVLVDNAITAAPFPPGNVFTAQERFDPEFTLQEVLTAEGVGSVYRATVLLGKGAPLQRNTKTKKQIIEDYVSVEKIENELSRSYMKQLLFSESDFEELNKKLWAFSIHEPSDLHYTNMTLNMMRVELAQQLMNKKCAAINKNMDKLQSKSKKKLLNTLGDLQTQIQQLQGVYEQMPA